MRRTVPPLCLVLLGLAAAAPAAGQDGKAPPDHVARWTQAFEVMARIGEEGGEFIREMSGSSYSVPKGDDLAKKLAVLGKLEREALPKAKELIAALEADWGPNDRQWQDAIARKFGVEQRIRGSLMKVVDTGQRPDGKGELQPWYYHRQLVDHLAKLDLWKQRILGSWKKTFDEALSGDEGRRSKEKISFGEFEQETGEYRAARNYLENYLPTAQLLAKELPQEFGEYPAKLEAYAAEIRKHIDGVIDAYALPDGMTEEAWGDDYDACLAGAYEFFPKALHVRLSRGWRVEDRNLIGEPMQHKIDCYAVHELDRSKNLAKVSWVSLYTKEERNSPAAPPFVLEGDGQYYLMRLDKVPASTRPGGLLGTLFKLVLAGGCCVFLLAGLGGGAYLVMKQSKAAAAGAEAGAPPAGDAGAQAPPPQA